LLRIGAGRLAVVDSDATRASELARQLGAAYGRDRVEGGADAAAALAGADGLVHATPTGMDKLPGLPLDAALLRPELWISEIVYFPLETALLKAARHIGCATADGGHMAVGQAFGAFELFTGERPDATRMDAHFRSLVAAVR
jgi:shikimate dehydrogenase